MPSDQGLPLTLRPVDDALQDFVAHSVGGPDPTVLMSAVADDEHQRREQEKAQMQAYFSGATGAR